VGGTTTSSGGGKVSQIHVFALGGDPMQFAAPGVETGGQTPEEIAQLAQQEEPDVAQFIALDAEETNKVNLTVIAALDPTNGGLNFNGYADGNAIYRVPEGATVEVTFKNLSTQSPHSAMIVPDGVGRGTHARTGFRWRNLAESRIRHHFRLPGLYLYGHQTGTLSARLWYSRPCVGWAMDLV
jgi:hypothetical protein